MENTPPEPPATQQQDIVFQALERRWHELYDGQTLEEVREKIHHRLLAASDTNHSLDSRNHPHPKIPSAPRSDGAPTILWYRLVALKKQNLLQQKAPGIDAEKEAFIGIYP